MGYRYGTIIERGRVRFEARITSEGVYNSPDLEEFYKETGYKKFMERVEDYLDKKQHRAWSSIPGNGPTYED